MKKSLLVGAVAVFGATAFAGGLPETMPITPGSSSDMGVYVGLQGGYGVTNWKNTESFEHEESTTTGTNTYDKALKDNAFAGRVFVGADLSRYFAVEFGYNHFFNKPKIEETISQSTSTSSETWSTAVDTKTELVSFKNTMALDLMAKLKAPVAEGFDLYAKVGVSYLMSRVDKSSSNDYKNNGNNFNLAFGAGADYYITPNVIANVEWVRYGGKAKIDSNYQPSADLFLLGVRYKLDI